MIMAGSAAATQRRPPHTSDCGTSFNTQARGRYERATGGRTQPYQQQAYYLITVRKNLVLKTVSIWTRARSRIMELIKIILREKKLLFLSCMFSISRRKKEKTVGCSSPLRGVSADRPQNLFVHAARNRGLPRSILLREPAAVRANFQPVVSCYTSFSSLVTDP